MTVKYMKKMKVYASELLNLSVETMNSIVEDIIDLLQDKLQVRFIIGIQKCFCNKIIMFL